MSATELVTQIPGKTSDACASAAVDPIEALAARSTARVVARVATLSDADLQALVVFERDTRNREPVLAAIDAVFASRRNKQDAPPNIARAVEQRPRFGGMRLTQDGWVVSEGRA